MSKENWTAADIYVVDTYRKYSAAELKTPRATKETELSNNY